MPSLSDEMYDKALAPKDAGAEVPDYINQALLNSSAVGGYTAEAEKRFDVTVKDIPAKAFFLSLVADAGVNVVTHPEVAGAISLDLRNVSVPEVLSVVRDIYGYEYKLKDGIYTIFPRALRTEIFSINYIDIQRMGIADTSVSIGVGKSSEEESSSGSGGESSGGGSDTSAGGSSDGGRGGPGSRVQTINRTDFWGQLEKTIGNMIGAPAEGRTVMLNPQAGLLAVTAMPGEINAVREFLERSELSVKRQVVLETQILEVQLNDGFEAGINWRAIQGQMQYSYGEQWTRAPETFGEMVNSSQEVFSSVFGIADIRDFLSLLEEQGSVQVLSSPRVSTVNNQKAIIRVGTDEFFVTGVKNNTTASAASTVSSPELELSSFFSGISLDVTPQISADGDVILHIHPIISDVQDQTKEVTVGDSKFALPLALRDIRESDSVVRARSGQVIVLGGLMQKSNRASDGKQPVLGDIPLLNFFFRTKSRATAKTELVILLKPVVVGDDSWQEQLHQFRNFSAPPETQRGSR
jgi:MSHA biogenesis protein MshL